MFERKWLPSKYMDEVCPQALESPDDWVITLEDGSYALRAGYPNEPDEWPQQTPLHEGQLVRFNFYQNLGDAVLTINEDKTWFLNTPTSEPIPYADNYVWVQYDHETTSNSIQEMIDAGSVETGEHDINFFAELSTLRLDR